MIRLLSFVVICCLGSLLTCLSQMLNPSQSPVNLVWIARIRAEQVVAEKEISDHLNYTPRPSGCPCAFDTFNTFNRETPIGRNLVRPTILRIETLKQLRKLTNLPVDVLISDPVFVNAWLQVFPCLRQVPQCNVFSRFRTVDGSCNNLNNPILGTAYQAQGRFLKPEYLDDIDLPRTRAVDGRRLPRVRDISNIIARNTHGTCFDDENTLTVLSWGSAVVFDVVATPATSTDRKGRPFSCCFAPSRPECFNINVDINDPYFRTTCIGFVRSTPALFDKCLPGRRQQLNQVNSYFDCSQVYGSTQEESNAKRFFRGGLLAVDNQNFPTLVGSDILNLPSSNTGIANVVVQVALVRLHNIFATKLSFINPHWNDERIYQETRRIIGAVTQQITYEEYIPTFLNEDTRTKFCLKFSCELYDENESPVPRIGYSVASGRFGHSQIGPSEQYINAILQSPYGDSSPEILNFLTDALLNNNSAEIDRKFEFIIRNQLFIDNIGNSYDLFSVNLQRGRDTAVPSYNRWREFCGLPRAVTFSTRTGGLVNHTPKNARLLHLAYGDPELIDLYAGGISEIPLPGAKVGPTFSCILATQFRIFKVADRFFYNRRDPVTGFTTGQRKSIRNYSLAKIFCETLKRRFIQRDVFRITCNRNPLVPCEELSDINLNLWKEI